MDCLDTAFGDNFGISSEIRNELTKICLLQMYGSLDQADLFVGALAEELMLGGVLGATLSCIFAITFNNLRNGDRFWYENTELGVFTSEQHDEIKSVTLSKLLCDNAEIEEAQASAFLLANDEDNALGSVACKILSFGKRI